MDDGLMNGYKLYGIQPEGPLMPKKSDNRVRFTVSYLNRQLKPSAKSYRVYDEGSDKLCVRVMPSGRHVFEVIARIKGSNTKTSKICDVPNPITAEELANVRARAREKLAELTRGDDEHAPEDARLLFKNVADDFLKDELDRLRKDDYRIPEFGEPRIRWPENERRKAYSFDNFQTYLDQKNADLIKKAKPPIRYIDEIKKDLIDDFILNYRYYNPRYSNSPTDLVLMSMSTQNKAASAFSTLMKWAKGKKLIVANSYLDRTETPLPESDVLFLEDDEFDYTVELLEADYETGDKATKIKAAAILLYAFTGSRNTETITMKWRDTGGKFDNYIDLQNQRFVYQDHKTRKKHRTAIQTAMSSSAKSLLMKLRRDVGTHGPYIFYSHQSIDGYISIRTTNDYFKSRVRPALVKKFGWLEPTPGYDEPNPRNLR
ncbi:MAG: hypothetical protein CMH88_10560, partial [Oceanibulbus sp.]|nr:hypothetical protein [Sulfitobacter sp.]